MTDITPHRMEQDRCANRAEDYQAHPHQLLLACQRCADEAAQGRRPIRCTHGSRS